MSELSLGLTRAAEASTEKRRLFFDVSVTKLVVMSIVTFGFYQVYWFYRHWRMAKERGESVIPILRAIFGVLFAYALFQEIREAGRARSLVLMKSAGALAFLYFILQLTWRLPDPFWLLGCATVVPLAIAQRDIAELHRSMDFHPDNNHFTALNIVGIILGGLFWVLVVLGLMLPDTAV